ncbi:MAG TPA: SRPBCC family protein [Flavobacteriales bacterium]|nr:SRPBCC family protein [Flavobacteriales bacterium]
MNTGIIARATAIIHEPVDRVWKALVDPEMIARYMMGAQVFSDWKEGSPIVWKGEWKGKAYEDHGQVLKVKEPELLKYSHRSGSDDQGEEHTVTIELKEVAGVTHLRLTQDNNATEEARQHSEENWNRMLDGLKKVLGEAPVAKPEVPRV